MSEFRDEGPWSLFTVGGEVGVISEDFTHDVVLWVNGDFTDREDKIKYANELAVFLNLACN